MLNFKNFILTEEILRQGLSHINDLKHNQLFDLVKDGKIKGSVTEKSDGSAFEIGHDDQGFYTRTSHSEKMRNPGDYTDAVKQKYGDSVDPEILKNTAHFDDIHKQFQQNKKLTDYLKNNSSKIKGEVFYKKFADPTPNEKGEIKLVGTHYDPNLMGKSGSFIVHSRLPENSNHDIEHLKTLGDSNFNIDHDCVNSDIDIDAKEEKEHLDSIDKDLLVSRKSSDKERKQLEKNKLDNIKQSIHNKIKTALSSIPPKWGSETEGYVIHPHTGSPAPRVKIISDTFKQNKREFKRK